jgi:hypothetical protein
MAHDFRNRPVVPPAASQLALRARSVSTKLTEADYAKCRELAGAQRVSEWARDVLLAAITERPIQELLLAEVLALRSIVINLQIRVAISGAPTMDEIRQLVDRSDQDKLQRAVQCLTAAKHQ